MKGGVPLVPHMPHRCPACASRWPDCWFGKKIKIKEEKKGMRSERREVRKKEKQEKKENEEFDIG